MNRLSKMTRSHVVKVSPFSKGRTIHVFIEIFAPVKSAAAATPRGKEAAGSPIDYKTVVV